MTIDYTAIESTLPDPVTELVWELERLDAPVHITARNRVLRAKLGDVDDSNLAAAVRLRKLAECEACQRGRGRHSEPDGARVAEFTPGAR